ncbi:MAG: homoserine kinase [Nostocaceae cyanobacterium]|nr:homoserine kinase [Nostocaceae cyanobacterium]
MSAVSTVIVTVPATTANLGPGFDCIGAALTLYNEFKFTRLADGGVTIAVTGKEAARVETNESNLGYQAFLKLYEYLGQQPPPVKIEIKLGVPLARGLGSSATAIVGGLVGANMLAGEPLSQLQVMELAIAMVGHPDNVVPALIGGCRLAATGLGVPWEIAEIPWNQKVIPVVAIPDFELSTQEARSVLPTTISRADTIFNVSHLGLLLRGLETGKGDWLQAALQDRLHQPYRQALIPGYADVSAAAMAAGAYGMVISGAGPTLLALADLLHAADVAVAMQLAWKKVGIGAEVRSLALDLQGAKIS